MNRSIVIMRYAAALVKYVRGSGHGDIVCSEAEALLAQFSAAADLRRMIVAADDVISPFDKKKLLQTALGGRISPEMSRFLSLLNQNGRMGMAEEILRDFVDAYRRSIGIRKARLVTAEEPSLWLLQRLSALVRNKTGDDVVIDVVVDPSIIGGFVFDIDDYLLDASVSGQLRLLKEEFVQRNRRII